MTHPILSRTSRTVATATIAGATLLLPLGAAQAQLLGGDVEAPVEVCEVTAVVEALDEACAAVDELLDEALGAVTDQVEAVAAPVTDAVVGAVAPVTDAVGVELLPADEGPAEPVPAPATGNGDTAEEAAPAAPAAEEPVKVQAAGKAPTEVTEPEAPAADGRVAGTPTIQPADLGANIAGVRSQNGLTLQPYQPPMVSVPVAQEAPQVAVPPSTTATPIVEAAADMVRFTGDALLPHTSGAAAWVTATGLGLLGAAGYAARRRMDTLTATALDS